MNRFFCFFLSCLLVFACFQTISTVKITINSVESQYFISTVQFLQGCVMSDDAYAELVKELHKNANALETAEEREKYLANNAGATVVYEIKTMYSHDEDLSGKLLFLFVSLILMMFLTLNIVIFSIVAMFQVRFAKVNILMSALTLIGGIITSIASVSWSVTKPAYATSLALGIGNSTIYFVLYPLLMLVMYAIISKKEFGKK